MPCNYNGDSLLNVSPSAADIALNTRGCDETAYLAGVVEEFIDVSGLLVDIYQLANHNIDGTDTYTPSTETAVATEVFDNNAADPILGEMRKRNYSAMIQMRAIPDSVERENYLQKFGLYNQEQIVLHFALLPVERDLTRKIEAGDLIKFPDDVENRWYEVSDSVRADYMLYKGLVWKVTVNPAAHSQDQQPIVDDNSFGVQYGSDLLSNTVVEQSSTGVAPNSGIDYLDPIE